MAASRANQSLLYTKILPCPKQILITKEHFSREPKWVAQQLVGLAKSTVLIIHFEQDKRNKLRSTVVGIWHGIIGRTGQYFPEGLATSYHGPRGVAS